jgi:integrase
VDTLDKRMARVHAVWRDDGVKASSITVYSQWVRRFLHDCAARGRSSDGELTLDGVRRFATRYARRRAVDLRVTSRAATVAVHTWARASSTLGYQLPRWCAAPVAKRQSGLLKAFTDHQRQHRGVREVSIAKQCDHVAAFLAFLRRRHRLIRCVRLTDIDAFVIARRRRYALTVVADTCSSLRAFLRFLHATGRMRSELASAVQAPCIRRGARLPRALPWPSVIRLLRAIDRGSRVGRRDYALVLLMATYGMGAGEVTSITLDDLDWQHGTLRVQRPKTGVPIVLPLLPAVARALVAYLRRGRPRSTPCRRLFVSMTGAHAALTSSSAVRHIVQKHARSAGLPHNGLGSHTLRHSHATRQINAGAPVPVVSDILGHRSPAVLSTYARVALDRLRAMALPVPT